MNPYICIFTDMLAHWGLKKWLSFCRRNCRFDLFRENNCNLVKKILKVVSGDSIGNTSALVRLMVWCRRASEHNWTKVDRDVCHFMAWQGHGELRRPQYQIKCWSVSLRLALRINRNQNQGATILRWYCVSQILTILLVVESSRKYCLWLNNWRLFMDYHHRPLSGKDYIPWNIHKLLCVLGIFCSCLNCWSLEEDSHYRT